MFLGPNLTLATDPIGIGADFEVAIDQNWGLGGVVRYWGKSFTGYSWSIIVPQFQALYHFMPEREIDPYAGARLGYAVVSVSNNAGYSYSLGSDLFLTATGGLRYFFNPKISVNGSLELQIGGTDYFASSVGLMAGVDFTL